MNKATTLNAIPTAPSPAPTATTAHNPNGVRRRRDAAQQAAARAAAVSAEPQDPKPSLFSSPALTPEQELESLRIRKAHWLLFDLNDPSGWQTDLHVALITNERGSLRPGTLENASRMVAFNDTFDLYRRLFEVRQNLTFRNGKLGFDNAGFLPCADVIAYLDKWCVAVPSEYRNVAEFLLALQKIFELKGPAFCDSGNDHLNRTHVRLRADRIVDALKSHYPTKYSDLAYQ